MPMPQIVEGFLVCVSASDFGGGVAERDSGSAAMKTSVSDFEEDSWRIRGEQF